MYRVPAEGHEGYEDLTFIVNHSKKCFINKDHVNGEIHPLPLLTHETVGGGGGRLQRH